MKVNWHRCVHNASVTHRNYADIGEMGSDSIARVLPKNPSLAHLDLSWNGVGESSGIRIGEALAVNTRLKRLNISSCRITYPVARVIADSLRFNTTLNTIDLSNNPLGASFDIVG